MGLVSDVGAEEDSMTCCEDLVDLAAAGRRVRMDEIMDFSGVGVAEVAITSAGVEGIRHGYLPGEGSLDGHPLLSSCDARPARG